MPDVLHLFVAKVHRFPMRPVAEATAVRDTGFEGCIHGRAGSKRQILLMDIETLEKFGLKPGAVKENITSSGLKMTELRPALLMRVGEALLEITIPCHPCSRMDELRPGLQSELRGQRGWLARVLEGGIIRQGDHIEIAAGESMLAERR